MISKRDSVVLCVGLVLIAMAEQSSGFGLNLQRQPTSLEAVYRDESRCLTSADMRGDQDMHMSCWCRDAIVDARYVYFTYVLGRKDPNLNGVFLSLEARINRQCGKGYQNAHKVATRDGWKWDGPEVVRTYPTDDVISRIAPEMRDGKPIGRWVPFTVQLIFRDAQGHVKRTENYSSRELVPLFK
jgi:hypothetical protein